MNEAKEMIKGISRYQRISSCVFSSDDFKKLYRLLSQKAQEAFEMVRQELKEKERTFSTEERSYFNQSLLDALRLIAYVTGTKGEQVIFTKESAISPETMPEDIETISIGSAFAYNFVFKADPGNKFEVRLNFTKSKLLDFSNPWSFPVESKNYIKVDGNNETWVNGVFQSIISFFQTRVKGRSWLHARHTYDLLLWLLGIPAIFWVLFRLDTAIRSAGLAFSNVLLVAIYLYVAFSGLFVFRLFFNYARWVFPQHEYRTEGGTRPGKHRKIFWAIFVGAGGALVWSIVSYLFGHLF